ncbi:hypothetical protein, partial [Vibrio breoganii]|uniref:hypothetical protein n=1 Tax=Vibrio breoganii TaxID=553239 RepID=UPI001A7E1742
ASPYSMRVMTSKAVILNLIQNLRECLWLGFAGSKILDRYCVSSSMTPFGVRLTASKDGKGRHSELDSES